MFNVMFTNDEINVYKLISMEKGMLIEKIRNKENKCVGYIIASILPEPLNQFVTCGISLCHKEDKNNFNAHLGKIMALQKVVTFNREYKIKNICVIEKNYPRSYEYLHYQYFKFLDRMGVYYKDKNIILPKIKWI